MKNLQPYVGINLAVLVIYTVFSKVYTMKDHESLGYLLLMMLLVSAHAFINFLLALVQFGRGDRKKGKP